MYNPDDSYIQNLINKGIRLLEDAIYESTDKLKTKQDIQNKLKKELGISDDIDMW